MLADLRDALRQLRKSPGFTATAVITLALGIGATTAIFTLVHQVMLKSLPVPKPEELWRIGDKDPLLQLGWLHPGRAMAISPCSPGRSYKHFRAHTPEFMRPGRTAGRQCAARRSQSRLRKRQADTRNGEYVSGNFFRTLGIHPWIGRMMTDADDQEGAPLGGRHELPRLAREVRLAIPPSWAPAIRSTGIRSPSLAWRPPGFYGAQARRLGHARLLAALTKELLIDGATARLKRPDGNFLDLIGRVRPGSESEIARSQTQSGVPRLARQPRARHGARRKATLATTDAASDPRRRRRRGHARSVSGRAEAAVDRGGMRAAGRLRQSGQSDAGARAERSCADLDPRCAGRFPRPAGAQGPGRIRAARGHRRSPGHRRRLRRNQADSLSRLPDRRPE